ncbi:MFS transporter [Paraburkholderia sp.]|uniref:MFS transporter n=1 Tax=Paraburkholderia sp. TaxID=1926495 RepID=UPI0023849E3C|nr:MFS transporter [Paraburkholderia sp.]MDE1180516.1 MFS transporter [Paraburkholderia sp.]
MNPPSRATAFTLLAVACLTIMVGCVIVPGLPAIAPQLGVERFASALVTVPSLGVVVLGPLAGWLTARTGLYRTLCIGLFSYGLLGVGGAWLHGPVAVFADRFLLGGATALVMTSGTGLISVFYDGHARLAMIAKQGMSIELGGVVFLFAGGLLAAHGWRWPFALYLFAWLMLALVLAVVPAPSPVAGSTHPAHHAGDHARDARTPVSNALRTIYVVAIFSMVSFFTGVIVLPMRFHELGIGEAQTGYFLSFVSLVAVGAAASMPRATARIGESGVLVGAFVFYAAAHLCFALADSVPVFVVGGVCMGCGFGLSVPLVNHMTVEKSHPRQRGRNLAYLSMAIFFGQFASSFMAYMPGNAARIFSVAAVMALVLACVPAAMRRTLASDATTRALAETTHVA